MAHGGIAMVGDRIAYVGEVEDLIGPETKVLDGRGRIAIPGLIEGHIHTYESHLPITEIARGFFPHGVTTIVTDFYGEAVVRGLDAIKASLAEAAGTGLNILFILPMPALYQDEPFLHTRTINLPEMEEMAAWPECHGLNECFIKNLTGGEPMLRKLVDIVQAHGGKVCGHHRPRRIRCLRRRQYRPYAVGERCRHAAGVVLYRHPFAGRSGVTGQHRLLRPLVHRARGSTGDGGPDGDAQQCRMPSDRSRCRFAGAWPPCRHHPARGSDRGFHD
jgi:hypothetical protein